MKNILNITLILLGAFLFGLGIDLSLWCIKILGFILMLIMIIIACDNYLSSINDK